MSYAIVILVIVVLVVIAAYIRRLWKGHSLVTSLLTGQFDKSPVAQQFSIWFKESPAREEQRGLFVQLTLGLGCSTGVVADRLMHCIMEVWRGQGARFGDALVQELDSLIIFDPAKSKEQAEQQRIAVENLADLKTRMRALDSPSDTKKKDA
jgi:hypothetical protein